MLEELKMPESHVFRDAIHGYIHVEHVPIWQLINTAEFQRLRRIKQLGGSSMVFPSAEHSRFVHSLGTYELVRQLTNHEAIRNVIDDYETLTVMCAGLLHDIGHGPFSHSFEEVFGGFHEDMTVKIILGPTEVNKVLSYYDRHLPEDVAAVIKKTHPRKVLVQMVTSQLDADRMDYLARDSYFAGVTYGEFDRERILRTLRVVDQHIVFKESGVQAIEDYILARYYMYWQVYYHPTSRSYEHLLNSLILRIKDLYKEGYPFKTNMRFLRPFLEEKVTVRDYIALDETVLMTMIRCFREEEDRILSDLADRFLNRRLFKYQTLVSGETLKHVKACSENAGYDPRYYVTDDDAMQIPYTTYNVNGHIGEIDILQPDGHVCPLPERSEIVHTIIQSRPKQDKKVFYVKEIENEL